MLVATRVCLFLFSGLLASQAPAQGTPDRARSLKRHCAALSGQDRDTRRAHIQTSLRQAGWTVAGEEYVSHGRRGKNLVGRLGEVSPGALLLCAHLDHLSLSPGANDNASGCAVLLELATWLTSNPRPSVPVVLLFADGGKGGHLGVLDYLKRHGGQLLRGAVSVDLVGFGETLLLSPPAPLGDNPLLGLFAELPRGPKTPLRVVERLPPSDHASLAARGIPALCLSAFPTGEVAGLQAWLAARGRGLAPPATLQRALGHRDNMSSIDPSSLQHAFRILTALLVSGKVSGLPLWAVRPDLPRDLRRLRALLTRPELLAETKPEERSTLLAALGPRPFMKALARQLADTPEAALAACQSLLLEHVASGELRQGLAPALRAATAAQLRARLLDVYRRYQSRMIWNGDTGAIELTRAGSGKKR